MSDPDLPTVRRAQFALAAIFFTNGFVIGSWAPHIPSVQERLALGPGALGFVLLAMAVGAVIAMPLTGFLVTRAGSAAVTRAMAVAGCLLLPLPVLAPNVALLVLAFLLFGAATGALDVAMNAQGVAIERRLPRPTMSRFHGSWSLGGLAGAATAAILLGHIPGNTHVIVVAIASLGAMLVAGRRLLEQIDSGASGSRAFALPRGLAVGLGVLAFLALLGEGAILDWSAVYLRSGLAADTTTAAMGFAVFSGAMALARFVGDRLRGWVGATMLVRAGATLAALGLGVGLAAGNEVAALLGFACAGLGFANIVPVLFSAAGRLPGQSPGAGIAAVATLGYAGFLAGPPVIGFVAEFSTLAIGLAIVPLSCVVIGLAASITSAADRPAGGAAGPIAQSAD